jgi:hypothetical protein
VFGKEKKTFLFSRLLTWAILEKHASHTLVVVVVASLQLVEMVR